MNPEQSKDLVRHVVTLFGGMIAGWFAAKGWLTTEQVMGVLNSPAFIGIVGALVTGAWGFISRSDKNMVAAADAVPGVQGVITKRNQEGIALAESVPSETVAPAGTVQAEAVAKQG